MAADRRSTSTLGPLAIGTIVLTVACLALAAYFGLASFSPGPPTVDRSTVQRVDHAEATRDAAPSVPFALRSPTLGEGWLPQSADLRRIGAGQGLRLGWLTPENSFLRIVQSNASAEAMVLDEQGDPAVVGTEQAAGLTWTVYRGIRNEALWVTDVGGVRWLLTGDAPPARFAELAAAAVAAPVVAPR